MFTTHLKLSLQNELLSRKLAYQCAKKVTYLVNETEAMSQPQQNQQQHGANEQQHPVISAFLELTNDPYTRFIILGLSSILQTIATECSTALVWHYFGENKTPSSLLGSPLDYLPNCAPSALPMPPNHNNQELRHRIRECEQFIKERSHAVEGKISENAIFFIT
jgi:mediator of RNA polymerase II transcription subunit 12